jgi:hypothetical protein
MAPSTTNVRSSILLAFCLHPSAFIFLNHSLYLPAIWVWDFCSRLTFKSFQTNLVWSVLLICPNHCSLLFLISAIRSGSLYNSLCSWLVLIIRAPCSVLATGPCSYQQGWVKMSHSFVFMKCISYDVDHCLTPWSLYGNCQDHITSAK